MTETERAAYEAGFRECQRRAAEGLEAWRDACLRRASRIPKDAQEFAMWATGIEAHAKAIRALAPEPPAPAPGEGERG